MFLHTLLFVFLAEMADKTQLMVMALTNKYSCTKVLLGMILGVLSISGVSVLAGDFIGDIIPMEIIKLGATLMFLGYGFLNLTPSKEEDGKQLQMRFPIVSIALTFFIAELGDKTQLATVAIAADHMDMHLAVFLGASCGLIMANIFGIFAGKFIFSHCSEDFVKVISSFIFFLFGSITLFELFLVSYQWIWMYSTLLIGMAYLVYKQTRKQRS